MRNNIFNKKILHHSEFFLVFFFLFYLFLFSQREFIFFRDYSIIYEGAYRISLGQIPFNDFGLPIGPVSLLFPTGNVVLWTFLGYSHNFSNYPKSPFVLIFHSLLKKLKTKKIILLISLFFFIFFYLILLSHPWYNTTATILLFAHFWLALNNNRLSIILCGFLCCLTFLTKQDFGLICFILSSLIILKANYNTEINSLYKKIKITDKKTLFQDNFISFRIHCSNNIIFLNFWNW